MGREARRAQERADRRQKQREAAPGRSAAPALTAPSSPTRDDTGGSPLKPRWALDIISELRKVTWPSRRETVNLTGVVITVALALGVMLGGTDLFFGWLIQHTLLR